MRGLAVVMLLVGCVTTSPSSPILYTPTSIKIFYADKPMINKGKEISGWASWSKDTCYVVLPRQDLRCAVHEIIMHCFKGPFHGDLPSREYCNE